MKFLSNVELILGICYIRFTVNKRKLITEIISKISSFGNKNDASYSSICQPDSPEIIIDPSC
jgi:hypothetical protein